MKKINMIETVEGIYRYIAEKFNLDDLFNENTGFYIILETEVEFESGVQNVELEEKIQQQISQGGAYGFYLDTTHLEIDELIVSIGLQEQFVPYDENNPDEFSEMISLHELAHLIEMQGLSGQLGIELSECDFAIGDKIQQHLNRWDTDLVHNREFVAILNHLIRREYPDNYTHKLRVAMSRTVIDIENDILEGDTDEDYYDCEIINN